MREKGDTFSLVTGENIMLWSYVKQNLIDLGFEEAGYLNDPAALSIFCTATNKARRIISQIKPLIERYDFTQKSLGETTTDISGEATTNPITINGESVTAETGNRAVYDRVTYVFDGTKWVKSGLVTYDIRALTEDSGNVTFDHIDKMQIVSNGEIDVFNDYTLEQGYKVVMDTAQDGDYTVFYARRLDNITPETSDDFDIQMDYEVEHLVPLLAGHYAWLDDDIQKATMYYNEYEQLANQIIMRLNERDQKTTKMKVRGGFRWH